MNVEKIRHTLVTLPERAKMVEGKGEEATKQALILPFLNAMGYDVWNPAEVLPEYEGDFAIKKLGQKEKVDYALLIGGRPRIFIEVKAAGCDLEGHQGQLARYFNAVPEVPLGVLTNGVEYRFFSDTAEPNVMDPKPFFAFRIDAPELGLDVLMRFERSVFSPENVRELATELHYTSKIVNFLRAELDVRDKDLSDSFIRWILASPGMYDTRVTVNVVERFRPVAKNALTRVVREVVRRSVAAIDEVVSASEPQKPVENADTQGPASAEVSEQQPKIATTQIELDAFAAFRALTELPIFSGCAVYDSVERKNVPLTAGYRDTTGYFSIYVARSTFWICRLSFDAKIPWIGFNLSDEGAAKALPPGLNYLPPIAWSKYRLPLSKPEEIGTIYRSIVESAIKELVESRRPH